MAYEPGSGKPLYPGTEELESSPSLEVEFDTCGRWKHDLSTQKVGLISIGQDVSLPLTLPCLHIKCIFTFILTKRAPRGTRVRFCRKENGQKDGIFNLKVLISCYWPFTMLKNILVFHVWEDTPQQVFNCPQGMVAIMTCWPCPT